MRPDEVPDSIVVPRTHGDDETWTVRWVPADTLRTTSGSRAWGATCFSTHTITLDGALRYNPTKLSEVWWHELFHACAPRTTREGRPRFLPKANDEENTVAFYGAAAGAFYSQMTAHLRATERGK